MTTPGGEFGRPLFEHLRYCQRCCMPQTAEGLAFDDLGICQPCRSSEQKIHIDWAKRRVRLSEILEGYRGRSPSGYDCIVPISGGKDSTFQLHVLTRVFRLRCLAATFSHNWYSPTGRDNLTNALEKFAVDHVMFTPNQNLIGRLAKESLYKIGDPCWHCHQGIASFVLQTAVHYRIPLIVWGESAAENHGTATYENPIRFDREYFTRCSSRFYAEEMANDEIGPAELRPFMLPTYEELEAVGVVGIHLGDYLFWDDERQMEFVRDVYGWKEDRVEGTYKRYKSVECRMSGLHDYTKFLKRGFGRGTDHASRDVRAGLLTREEGFELARAHDPQRPEILDWYLNLTGLTEEEFLRVMQAHREATIGPAASMQCERTGLFGSVRTRPRRGRPAPALHAAAVAGPAAAASTATASSAADSGNEDPPAGIRTATVRERHVADAGNGDLPAGVANADDPPPSEGGPPWTAGSGLVEHRLMYDRHGQVVLVHMHTPPKKWSKQEQCAQRFFEMRAYGEYGKLIAAATGTESVHAARATLMNTLKARGYRHR